MESRREPITAEEFAVAWTDPKGEHWEHLRKAMSVLSACVVRSYTGPSWKESDRRRAAGQANVDALRGAIVIT